MLLGKALAPGLERFHQSLFYFQGKGIRVTKYQVSLLVKEKAVITYLWGRSTQTIKNSVANIYPGAFIVDAWPVAVGK